MRRAVKMKPPLPLVTFPSQHCPSQDEPLHRHWAKPAGSSGALWGSVGPADSSCTLFFVLLQSEPGIICTRPDASLLSVALSHLCTTPTGRRWVVPIFPFCLLHAMVSLKLGVSTGPAPVVLSWTSSARGSS